jgi:hypothetical protein
MKALETESRCSRPGAGPVTVWLTVMVILTVFSLPLYPAVKLSPPVVVQGEQWALYDVSSVKGAPYCMPYENSGYSLEIQGVDPVSRRVMVHSRQGDLDSRAVFPPQPGSIPPEAAVYAASSGAVPDLTALARSLTCSCRTQYQAVNRVLCWVSGAIDYRTGPGVPVKPREVWRQGAGNCVGASELAVALLREVGIPARGVRGFLAPGSVTGATTSIESRESSLGQEGLHRWIEVYYPGQGWIFSDPFRSVNFVSPRYLVFDLEAPPEPDPFPARFPGIGRGLNDPESTFVRLLERGGMIVKTDVLPTLEAREGMSVRRNHPVQYRPAFIGQVIARAGSTVRAPDEVHLFPSLVSGVREPLVAPVRSGIFSFTDLEEGEYRLVFYSGGVVVGSQMTQVHFPPRQDGAVRIELGVQE